MIPKTYEEWRHCITIKCGIPLTDTYIRSRLDVLKNETSQEVKKFRNLYGDSHLMQVIDWFTRALKDETGKERVN